MASLGFNRLRASVRTSLSAVRERLRSRATRTTDSSRSELSSEVIEGNDAPIEPGETPPDPASLARAPLISKQAISKRATGRPLLIDLRSKSPLVRHPLAQRALAWLANLSTREKGIILGGLIVVAVLGIDQTYTPISAAFSDQKAALASAQRNASATSAVVLRFSKLQARRQQLETRFREIEFKEGALSYIENLVRQQPGVAPGFDIREGTPKSFGKSYQQQPFTVRFQTTSSEGLVSFLKSIARGERSLLISKLDVQKPRRGDRLEVDMELNTIRKASS